MRAIVVALAVGGALSVALPTVAEAQQKKLDVRPEVRTKVKSAQDAIAKGNYSEAIRDLKDAKSVGALKGDEEYAVNELLIYAANGARDYRLLAQTSRSGSLPGGSLTACRSSTRWRARTTR